ncbi:MAG TPA: hypothetical protein VNY24_18490, partial [Candidatus Acidoferrales bacterium]|nr:hypothetical protein [Candidatus Acidoferrales bacterium]
VLAQQLQTIFAARADAGFVSLVLENAAQGFAYTGFVIDDQDVCHDLAEPRLPVERAGRARPAATLLTGETPGRSTV